MQLTESQTALRLCPQTQEHIYTLHKSRMHSMGFLVALSICLTTMMLPVLASPLTATATAAAAAAEAAPTTVRPKLIIVEEESESEPMRYQFITEHRPTTLGQNYYIKPGQIVGSINLGSESLHVRHDEETGRKPIASKHNILFVAYAKDLQQKTLAKV
ncbi:uncharacterized protein LOC117903091 [Drosophila subobscura]|uniref:uncharacterized protein LOC117903091 n=1 Tax=Drosophila subobscura TaxID=7241 RepID=UPI00155A7EB1|nr:uncharacterized protein LOC117903091 [Drosophila subobscura]